MLALTSPYFWYLVRGSGAVSLVLLTASLALGVAVAMRWSGRPGTRLVVEGMHRNISLLVMLFLGIHVATSVLDSFVHITLVDSVVPFTSSYQPLWLGLGALSLDILIALIATSLLRDRIGYPVWRLIHWSAYACWPVAFLHSIAIGTDSTQWWLIAVYVATALAVVVTMGWRIGAVEPEPTPIGSASR